MVYLQGCVMCYNMKMAKVGYRMIESIAFMKHLHSFGINVLPFTMRGRGLTNRCNIGNFPCERHTQVKKIVRL